MASGLRYWYLYLTLVALATISLALRSEADVVRQSSISIAHQHFDYVYRWSDTTVKPRAVAVIVHGLTLHGLTYDAFARHLAERGVIVYAPDLRGYGRWYKEGSIFDNATVFDGDQSFVVSAPDFPPATTFQQGISICQPMQEHKTTEVRSEIDYDKSRSDLLELVNAVKKEHPNLPLYCVGESLGAGFAMFAAAEKPECVDGLILSSPAIKRKLHVFPRLALDIGKVLASPKKELDLSPYFHYFDAKDNRIAQEKLNDPLVRKRLTLMDLYKTMQALRPSLKYAAKVAANTPVLIIQGTHDRILQADGIVELVSHLNSKDDTVMWFKDNGHLILETAYVQPDALNTIDNWIDRVSQNARANLPISVSYEIHDQLPGELAIYSN